jgi:ribosomal protein S2
VAEEVAQEEARFRLTVVVGAVDADADPYGCGHEIPGNERP